MRTCEQLIRALQEGAYDHIFKTLYAPDGTPLALFCKADVVDDKTSDVKCILSIRQQEE